MSHPPSEQQAAIISAAGSGRSIICSAGAGCAKTSTIEMLAPKLSGPATAMAFNVSIKTELEKRLPPTITCLTANGIGHRAWMKVIRGKLTLDTGKTGDILKPLLEAEKLDRGASSEVFLSVCRLVSLAKSSGIIPHGHNYKGLLEDSKETWEDLADAHWIEATELNIELSRRVLTESIKKSYQGQIDFDDQIYMSVLFGAPYDRRKIMIIDEAQDLSPINHLQIQKSHPEQLIVVGDPRQAIYGFRGADSNSMGSLESRFKNLSFDHLPLSVTFRCPQLVVKRQFEHYPNYTAFPSNPLGEVKRLGNWSAADLPKTSCAILCRNNAPILSLAFKLLRAKLPVQVLGKDIAKNLSNLLKKVLNKSDSSSEEMLRSIQTWQEGELTKAAGKKSRLEGVLDRVNSMRAICENSTDLTSSLLNLNEIFSREGRIFLATAHKAKGLEWDWVMHLDSFRVPSKHAISASDSGNNAPLEQEKNIRYVIETRTKHTLVFADLENFQTI